MTDKDDKFVIMGQGDEIRLQYQEPSQPSQGMVRQYVFSSYGYYKDGKTDLPKQVEPLPFAAMSNYPYGATRAIRPTWITSPISRRTTPARSVPMVGR